MNQQINYSAEYIKYNRDKRSIEQEYANLQQENIELKALLTDIRSYLRKNGFSTDFWAFHRRISHYIGD